MASVENNQKLSEIRSLPPETDWPTERNYVDPHWIEEESLLMTSTTIQKDTNKRKSRDMSTRFTYGELFQLMIKLLTTALTGTYTVSGRFNFATNATNAYCSNSPEGRNVITYKDLKTWLDGRSGLAHTLSIITYNDGTNPKY